MIVYLAAPIDFDAGSQVTRIKNEVKKHFKAQDCTWVYDPAGAWNAPPAEVEFVNKFPLLGYKSPDNLLTWNPNPNCVPEL
jgi:hypothetical protein